VPVSIAIALVITVLGTFYLGLFPGRILDAFRKPPASAPVRVSR
jgi:hypothetical protein